MIKVEREVKTEIDVDGNMTENRVDKITEYNRREEPDYIKIYTKMWCEFNQIPEKWQKLFMVLASRMQYACMDADGSQVVYTIGKSADAICKNCGWKNKHTLYDGLKALCNCGAIRKLGKGEYQVNPQYAGRGGWYYNPKENRGGIRELSATFNFVKDGRKQMNVDTRTRWVSGEKDEIGFDGYAVSFQSKGRREHEENERCAN